MKKTTTAAGVLALCVMTVLALSGCSTEEVGDGTAERKSFALEGERLTVVTDDSKLELVPVEGGEEVGVTRWFKASKVTGKASISWSMEGGDTLRLKTTCSGFITECNARHKVEVPKDVPVTVRGRDGHVVANGFSAPMSIRTDDGNVNVRGARARLSIETTDGNVRAERLRSASVSADTRDGYLILGFSEPPTSVRTNSRDGNTTVSAPRTPYKIKTSTVDGSVKVSLPRGEQEGRSIDASALDGNITLRSP